jgi:undecaprenyl-diphosphatase
VLTYLMVTVSMLGASALRVGTRAMLLAQLAAAFTNRIVPAGVGAVATNVRFLERNGATRSGALVSIALQRAAKWAVNLLLLLGIAPFLGRLTVSVEVPDNWVTLVGVLAAITVVGVAIWFRRAPRALRAWSHDVRVGVACLARSRWRLTLLLGGAAGGMLAYLVSLVASLRAFGATPPLLEVVAVFLAGSAVASVSPTPGGVGPFEGTLVAGLTKLGTPAAPAVAGVLAYRLITYWLPVIPGMFAFRHLRRHGAL